MPQSERARLSFFASLLASERERCRCMVLSLLVRDVLMMGALITTLDIANWQSQPCLCDIQVSSDWLHEKRVESSMRPVRRINI